MSNRAFLPPAVEVRTLETALHLTMTLALTGWLLLLLEGIAVRRGGSILRNMGARGWLMAFLLVFAAEQFSGVVTMALAISSRVPVDWTLAIVWGLVFGGLGGGARYFAWRLLVLERPPLPSPSPQKG